MCNLHELAHHLLGLLPYCRQSPNFLSPSGGLNAIVRGLTTQIRCTESNATHAPQCWERTRGMPGQPAPLPGRNRLSHGAGACWWTGDDVELVLLAVLPVAPPYAWHLHGCTPARRFADCAAALQPPPHPAAPPPRNFLHMTTAGGSNSKSDSTRGLLPLLCAGSSSAISLRRKGQHHSPAAASASFICPSAACSCHARCAAFDQGSAWPAQPCPPGPLAAAPRPLHPWRLPQPRQQRDAQPPGCNCSA